MELYDYTRFIMNGTTTGCVGSYVPTKVCDAEELLHTRSSRTVDINLPPPSTRLVHRWQDHVRLCASTH